MEWTFWIQFSFLKDRSAAGGRPSIVWFFMGAQSARLPIGVLPLINEHLIMMRERG